MGPLKDIKVIEMAGIGPAPFCGMILADMGAEVIKIEHPENGDLSRLGPPITKNFSHYYVQQNIGKKCISLDLNKKEIVAVNIIKYFIFLNFINQQ